MTIMTLSPIQHEYVTKKEFNGLKSYMNEGFDMTNKHIDNLEIKVDNLEIKVDNLKKHIDARFGGIDSKFAEQKEDIMALTKIVNKIAVKIL